MQITVNLTDPRANSIALDEVIFSQAETTLTFNVSPASESLADGLSVALLTPQGETLAHALVSASAAVLSTSTVECYEFAKGLPVEATRGAYLVIGESTSPKAIIPVQVARNPIAEIAPPTASAPVYPTSAELSAIIAEMEGIRGEVNADYQAVKALAESIETEVAQGVSQVQTAGAEAESAINTAKTNALGEVNTAKADALAAIDTAEASAVAFVEAKTQEGGADIIHAAETGVGLVNQAAGNAVDEIGAVKTQAEGELTALVGQAQTAKGEAETARDEALVARTGAETARTGAETAQHGAEEAQQAAETALNNGCVYEVEAITSPAIQLKKTITAYKHTPTADTAYTFTAPAEAQGKIIVFWLWIVMGEMAHQLTFPAGVTWISEGSFTANSQTMLAFMSVDGGATWQANVQWKVTA